MRRTQADDGSVGGVSQAGETPQGPALWLEGASHV